MSTGGKGQVKKPPAEAMVEEQIRAKAKAKAKKKSK